MIVEKDGLYYHAAFAEDDEGTGFSLTDFDGAAYVGNYVDKSATESTDWTSYSWQVRGEVSVTDLEDDTELMESVEESELQDAMEDAEEDRDELRADVIENDENLQATQHASDEGIGNLNELIGTNQGTNGWTASSGLTIEAVTGTIYNNTNDEVNYLKVTCNTAGSNYIYFDASKLREKLAQKLDTNAYTFSADVNMATPFSVDISVADLDGSNTQIEFEPITNDAVIDSDGAWIFNSSTGDVIQANNEPIPVSAQVLLFDLSNMTSGNVLMIANLKVEGGGLATPWRASLEEVKGMATEALNKATEVNQHFWHNTSGAHVTEVTQDEYEQDPTAAGGNVIIDSNGLKIYDGTIQLAEYTDAGITLGAQGYGQTKITPHGLYLQTDDLYNFFDASYAGGGQNYRPYYTLGRRNSAASDSETGTGWYTLTFGDYNFSNGEYVALFGTHLEDKGTNKLVIGKYNETDTNDEYAFVVADGTSTTSQNTFTVSKRGNVVASDLTTYDDVISGRDVIATDNVTDGYGNTLANKLDASALADYVIEEGTQSNWEYRKWNSGKVEAWRTITNSAAAGSVWVSPMYYRDLTVSIPSGLFTSAPKVQCTSTHNQWWVSYANCTSATSLAYRIVKPVSTSQASGVNIYLEGE